MKPDEFENMLRNQPLRQIPAGWRNEILASGRRPESAPEAPNPGWRVFLNRFPLAWGALAALWALLLGIHILLAGPQARKAEANARSGHSDLMTIWNLQRSELSLLNERPADAEQPATAVPPRPHTERRRDGGYGDALAEPAFSLPV